MGILFATVDLSFADTAGGRRGVCGSTT